MWDAARIPSLARKQQLIRRPTLCLSRSPTCTAGMGASALTRAGEACRFFPYLLQHMSLTMHESPEMHWLASRGQINPRLPRKRLLAAAAVEAGGCMACFSPKMPPHLHLHLLRVISIALSLPAFVCVMCQYADTWQGGSHAICLHWQNLIKPAFQSP